MAYNDLKIFDLVLLVKSYSLARKHNTSKVLKFCNSVDALQTL